MNFKKYLKENTDPNKAAMKQAAAMKKAAMKVTKSKIDYLNTMMEKDGYDFKFTTRETDAGFEFDVPLKVLLGPKTRKFCANLWNNIVKKGGVNVDFSEEIEEAVAKIGDIVITMKLNERLEEVDSEVKG